MSSRVVLGRGRLISGLGAYAVMSAESIAANKALGNWAWAEADDQDGVLVWERRSRRDAKRAEGR